MKTKWMRKVRDGRHASRVVLLRWGERSECVIEMEMTKGKGESSLFWGAVTVPNQAESHCLAHSTGSFGHNFTEGAGGAFQQVGSAISPEGWQG